MPYETVSACFHFCVSFQFELLLLSNFYLVHCLLVCITFMISSPELFLGSFCLLFSFRGFRHVGAKGFKVLGNLGL